MLMMISAAQTRPALILENMAFFIKVQWEICGNIIFPPWGARSWPTPSEEIK